MLWHQGLQAYQCKINVWDYLPNALPPIIVQSALMVGSAILFEAGLSFLGLTDPNVVSWDKL